ncbi:ATP-binding protein [Nostoc sp. PCC 7107]|uniref:ATP-binding protein n=1 Tax=Nostoc sp. PCC 7107 TaxID=317936 RepID=UPI00029F267C|nr:ATP-binding protein [Nostoc sp. PCC 7107]AFY45421.1 PAS/PAC sensor signal transduction histidine kinase [Nostoc sp. PCC 7107]
MDKLEKLEIALAKNQHLQFLKNILPETIKFIGLMQQEGNLLGINQSALNFCGLTSSDVLGKPLWEACWWHNSQAAQEAIKIAVACAAAGESVHYEVEILGAGDRLLTFNFFIKPITNQQGQIIFLILPGQNLPDSQTGYDQSAASLPHHSRLDGQVKICPTDQGSHYKFTVDDDEPGIAPEYQQKVFSIFQTLTARDRQENTGIGLAIGKKIVETEGGTISLDSNSAIGSSFHFIWKKQSEK